MKAKGIKINGQKVEFDAEMNYYKEDVNSSTAEINAEYVNINGDSNFNVSSYSISIEGGEDGISIYADHIYIGNTDGVVQIQCNVGVDGSIYCDDVYINHKEVAIKEDIPKEWVGTQEEFDALTEFDEKTTYYIV